MALFNYLIVFFSLTTASMGFSPAGVRNGKLRSLIKSSTSKFMFTGIIEEMGTVVELVERDDMVLWDGSVGTGTELTVKGDIVLGEAYLG